MPSETTSFVNLDYIDHIAIAVKREDLDSVTEWYQETDFIFNSLNLKFKV